VLVLAILDAVIAMHRDREGIVASSISSAVQLDDAQRARLEAMLAERSGKRVEAEYHVDPSLIGGITVRLGDTVYDGSVRRQLQRLRTRFITGT
jgi:F-type H+-transporting ATPase subunit delta